MREAGSKLTPDLGIELKALVVAPKAAALFAEESRDGCYHEYVERLNNAHCKSQAHQPAH